MKNVSEKKINVLPEIEGILSLSHTVRFIHNIDIKIILASQYSSYNCANKFRNILALVPHEFTKKYIHILYTYIMSLKSTYIQM